MMDGEAVKKRYLDPDLPAIRQRVVKLLHAEIGAILKPHGYVRKSQRWILADLRCVTYLELQKGRVGAACYINLGRDAPALGWQAPSYKNGTSWRIGRFAPATNAIDQLFYADLDGDSPLRRRIMTIIVEQAVPFLESCHGLRGHLMRPPPLVPQGAGGEQ